MWPLSGAQGPSAACIDLISKSIMTQSAKVYDNKWDLCTSWGENCNEAPVEVSLTDKVEFFTYLVEERDRAPSTSDGYRAVIRSVYKHTQKEQVLDTPMGTQHPPAGKASRRPPLPVPKWSLPLVVYYLHKNPARAVRNGPPLTTGPRSRDSSYCGRLPAEDRNPTHSPETITSPQWMDTGVGSISDQILRRS